MIAVRGNRCCRPLAKEGDSGTGFREWKDEGMRRDQGGRVKADKRWGEHLRGDVQ